MRKILICVAVAMLVAGLGLLLFPPISNFIGSLIANGETQKFDTQITNIQDGSYEDALKNGKIDKQGYPIDKNGKRTSNTACFYKVDIDKLKKDSTEYNNMLKTDQGEKLTGSYAYSKPSLDLTKYGIFDGIYGYVTADTIQMKLPIYLGANADNMSYGSAHLTYTSLPIGGTSTNTVLAGHTGYVGRIFFDNIKRLNKGDTVKLTNYWDNMNYTVTDKKIVNPNEAQDIFINSKKDLLTLVTCVSNGNGGFNRYIVICERKS